MGYSEKLDIGLFTRSSTFNRKIPFQILDLMGDESAHLPIVFSVERFYVKAK